MGLKSNKTSHFFLFETTEQINIVHHRVLQRTEDGPIPGSFERPIDPRIEVRRDTPRVFCYTEYYIFQRKIRTHSSVCITEANIVHSLANLTKQKGLSTTSQYYYCILFSVCITGANILRSLADFRKKKVFRPLLPSC